MKDIRTFVIGLLACAVAMAMATNLRAETAQQGLAKVVSIKGSARYIAGPNSTWQPLKTGDILRPGSILQTASGSYVDVVLNDASAAGVPLSAMTTLSSGAPSSAPAPSATSYQPKVQQDAIRIFENTVLGIDKLTVDQTGADVVTETQLDLKAGSIFGAVKRLSGASKYEVKIPNGVAGIRGTIFFISSDGMLRVLSGSVVLAYVGPDGAVITQVVSAGQQFDVRAGQFTSVSSTTLKEMRSLAKLATLAGARMAPLAISADHTLIDCVSRTRP